MEAKRVAVLAGRARGLLMDDLTRRMHLRAGLFYGRTATCGDGFSKPLKQDYRSEERADRSAKQLSARFGKEMEGYPCPFCRGWHIGRKMTPEEVSQFSREAGGGETA